MADEFPAGNVGILSRVNCVFHGFRFSRLAIDFLMHLNIAGAESPAVVIKFYMGMIGQERHGPAKRFRAALVGQQGIQRRLGGDVGRKAGQHLGGVHRAWVSRVSGALHQRRNLFGSSVGDGDLSGESPVVGFIGTRGGCCYK